MPANTPKKKKAKKKTKLTPEQKTQNLALKAQKDHIKEIRSVFTKGGFSRVLGMSKNITFMGVPCEVDDVFVYENIILIGEYTHIKSSEVSGHLKKKSVFFSKILENQAAFVEFLKSTFPPFKEELGNKFHKDQYNVKIFYASKNKIDMTVKKQVEDIHYFDYPILKYFLAVTKAIKISARNEILSFFRLTSKDIKGQSALGVTPYSGSILPEAHSNFQDGFKVLSFYVDPAALLQRSYVLRRNGWQDGGSHYQRMISPGKVDSIRKHLIKNRRVFINNIIVTLPSNTKVVNEDNDTIDFKKLTDTAPATILLPNDFNSIGIIDGQHRIYSYHEGGNHDDEITELRNRQNLLVTGIIYPKKLDDIEKTKFEANLFLEINSNQTNAKSELKQAIGVLVTPFAPTSIGRQVLDQLNDSGPLLDQLEKYFYDKDKIKTSSIISYGLIPIVKLSGDDSFYKSWKRPGKEALLEETDLSLLNEYIEYCASEINKFLIAVKKVMPGERWTTDKKVEGRLLTTTIINGFIICLRLLIEHQKLGTTDSYEKKLVNLKSFKFDAYHSSHYSKMAQELFKKYF